MKGYQALFSKVGKGNAQELIQSKSTSFPKNQMGKEHQQ